LLAQAGCHSEYAKSSCDGGEGAVIEAMQIGVLMLIPIACVVALVIVWRADHKWRL